MTNREKLKELLEDVLLLDESEFRFDLKREDIVMWDSLAVVSLAVGIEETFGYHLSPEEAMSINEVHDIINILETKGVGFAD